MLNQESMNVFVSICDCTLCIAEFSFIYLLIAKFYYFARRINPFYMLIVIPCMSMRFQFS